MKKDIGTESTRTAYINGIILTGEKDMTPIKDMILFTDGDKIEGIKHEGASTDGCRVIDLNGSYIMPGLINMHVHIPGSGKPKKKQSDVKKLVKLMTSNALMKKIAYEMCASYVKPELFSGVTTLRSVGGIQDLDAKLRVQLRNELKKMQKDFGITTIYVTHDQEEALTLSDRIAVFNSGVIEQVGTPNEVYNHSATEFVCNFIGDINRLGEGIVNELINMGAPVDPAKHNYIRLERIHVNVQPREGEIALDGTVESLEYYGLYIKYYITVCGQTIKVIEKNDGVNIYDAGQKVKAVFNPRDIMAYEPAAEAEVK